MADWNEVRVLANQLKAIQDDQSISKLSERTWVDIIRQLVSTNRLKLIFSNDGRSYLTSVELDKEIREEVEAHLGRITLTELASNLDLNFDLVESRVLDLVASDAQTKPPCRLLNISNEIINDSYIRRIAQEISDLLEENGEICISELMIMFGLPTTFILNLINDYQGTLFRIHKYGEKYITDAYLNSIRSKVRGHFTAVIRPVTLNSVSVTLGIQENVLGSIVSSLISSGRLNGNLVAGRGTFVPSCYTQAEEDYVNSFFVQNGCVEWDYLKRFGVADPGSYLKSKYPTAIHVTGLTIGQSMVDRLNDQIATVVRDSSWSDISHYIPMGLDSHTLAVFMDPLLKDLSVKLIDNTYLISNSFIDTSQTYFVKLIADKAHLAFCKEGSTLLTNSKKIPSSELQTPNVKRTPTGSKGGFGYGAREIKQKNVKKKYNPTKRRAAANSSRLDADDDNDDGMGELDQEVFIKSLFGNYVTNEELISTLTTNLPNDISDDMIQGILDLLIPELEHSFVKMVQALLVPGSDHGRLRERKTQTEEMVNSMILSFQILDRGIRAIDDSLLNKQLTHHLLKNHGFLIVQKLCAYIANEYGFPAWTQLPNQTLADSFQNLINLLINSELHNSTDMAKIIQNVVDKLQSVDCETAEFYSCLNMLAVSELGLNLSNLSDRKSDLKRDRDERLRANELAIQVELQLKDALDGMTRSDATLLFNLATTAALAATCLMVQLVIQWPVTAPGKCVPKLVKWIAEAVQDRTNDESGIVAILTNSNCVNDLQKLTQTIADQAKNQTDSFDFDQSIVELVKRLVNVISRCRKKLYSN